MSCGKRKKWHFRDPKIWNIFWRTCPQMPLVCSTFGGPIFLSLRKPSKPHATPLHQFTCFSPLSTFPFLVSSAPWYCFVSWACLVRFWFVPDKTDKTQKNKNKKKKQKDFLSPFLLLFGKWQWNIRSYSIPVNTFPSCCFLFFYEENSPLWIQKISSLNEISN